MELTPYCVPSFFSDEPALPATVQVLRITPGSQKFSFESPDYHMCVSDGHYFTLVYVKGVPPCELSSAVIRLTSLKRKTHCSADTTFISLFATFDVLGGPVSLIGQPQMWGYPSGLKAVTQLCAPSLATETQWKLEALLALRAVESVADLLRAKAQTAKQLWSDMKAWQGAPPQ